MYKEIKLSQIKPDLTQPRIEFDAIKLARLKKSIQEQGIINPLVIEKNNENYILIDGERRYRCAVELKLDVVPVTIIEKMDDKQRLVKRFHLQEMHANWTISEKAKAVIDLMDKFSMSHIEAGELLGIPSATVQSYSTIKEINPKLCEKLEEKRITTTGLINCGYLLKKTDTKNREKLQKALLDKISRGIITRTQDFQQYNRCAVHDRTVIDKIISDPNYSPYKAMETVGKSAEYATNSVRISMSYLKGSLENLYNNGNHLALLDRPAAMRDMKLIYKIIEKIAKDIRLNL